jgi:hypothetical protein
VNCTLCKRNEAVGRSWRCAKCLRLKQCQACKDYFLMSNTICGECRTLTGGATDRGIMIRATAARIKLLRERAEKEIDLFQEGDDLTNIVEARYVRGQRFPTRHRPGNKLRAPHLTRDRGLGMDDDDDSELD